MKRAVLSWSIVAALAGAGCYADHVTAPAQSAATANLLGTGGVSVGSSLIECPNAIATTTEALVTPLGGVVSLDGTSITLPAGAVLAPTLIRVTIPASNYMEVDISVPGLEHFIFEQPVTVTVSYARCNRADILRTPLTAWYIDSETKALLEQMVGVDNKLTQSVTFVTPHLSGYALAN
jgi:hypothetical protein